MNIYKTLPIVLALVLGVHFNASANMLGNIKDNVKEKAKAVKDTVKDTAKAAMPKLKSVAIVNKTGKKLKQVKVTFRFEGENNISDNDAYKKGYADGYVTIKNIENNDEINAYAKEATRHHVSGHVMDHFTRLTDVKVMRIEVGTLSYNDFIDGTYSPRFVISTQGRISPYLIETENEHSARLLDKDITVAEKRVLKD